MDNNTRIVDSNAYDNRSIWVVNPAGKLRRVVAPFRVVAIQLSQDGKRRYYIVDGVRSTVADQLVYIINGRPYLYSHFTIDIRF